MARRQRQDQGLRCFAVLEAECQTGQTVQRETRLYINSMTPDAERLARAIGSHWSVETGCTGSWT